MKCLAMISSVLALVISFTPGPLTHGQSADSKDSIQKAIINKKPEPKYTREAKRLAVTGTVILRCIFRSSGKITDITVIQGLPNGLTERAIEAAKKIKFQPAMKDGHPVSMWMQLEYNFNLY